MKLIRHIIVAFSLYSKIPMPVFSWDEEDMKHNLIFLPWIGIVIGVILTLSMYFLGKISIVPLMAKVLIYSIIPLIITGGFHLDGFMDVEDALKSYKSKEEKLKILKDPHIGAFSVIGVLVFASIWLSATAILTENGKLSDFILFGLVFVLSRCFSGITSLGLKHAKKDGMLDMETKESGKVDLIVLILEASVTSIVMIILNPVKAAIMMAGLLLMTLIYKRRCYKQFGGVTGDTAGYYLCVLEETMLVCLSIATMIINVVWS